MKPKTSVFSLSRLEIWGLGFAALVLLAICDAHDLLQRYGLISSTQVVHDQLSSGVGTGLQKLDSFSFTQNAATFVVWGVVGLIAFSILQTTVQTSSRLKYEQSLGSDQYVHPANFSRQKYWRRIITDTILSFILSACLLVGSGLMFFVGLPYVSRQTTPLLLKPGVDHVISFVVGLVVLLAASYAWYLLIKIAIRQHQHSQA